MTTLPRRTEEIQIRELLENWVDALRTKDIDALMAHYEPHVLLYDIAPPLRQSGAEAYRKNWQDWFASFQGPIGYEIHDLSISAGRDIAFSTSLNRITEQIQFLRRLHSNDLPFSEDVVATVEDIVIVEQTPDYTLRAKTGWAGFGVPDQTQIGWYVGYLEQNDNVYFFATNMDIQDEDDGPARLDLTRRCLADLGLL